MISVGRITKSVGVKGHVHVEPFSGRNDRLAHVDAVLVGTSGSDARVLKVEASEQRNDGTVLKLQQIDDRTEADGLRGLFLFVEDDNHIPLRPGSFFVHDIIGLNAMTEDGAEIGTVTDVLNLPAGDVWVVRMGEKEVMIPAVKEFVRKVDIPAGRVIIHTIEGLLE